VLIHDRTSPCFIVIHEVAFAYDAAAVEAATEVKMSIQITHHAAARATERFGIVRLSDAYAWLACCIEHAVHVPTRVLREITGREAPPRRKGAARFYVHGTAVMVVKGDRVVTVWPLTLDQLAELVVWCALRVRPS
jgi:hypothetical protein